MKYQSKPVEPHIMEALIWTGDNYDEANKFIPIEHGYQTGFDGRRYLLLDIRKMFLKVAPSEVLVKVPMVGQEDYYYVLKDSKSFLNEYEPVKE
jgi:hypothetical protein